MVRIAVSNNAGRAHDRRHLATVVKQNTVAFPDIVAQKVARLVVADAVPVMVPSGRAIRSSIENVVGSDFISQYFIESPENTRCHSFISMILTFYRRARMALAGIRPVALADTMLPATPGPSRNKQSADCRLKVGVGLHLGRKKLDLRGIKQGFVVGNARNHPVEFFKAFGKVG